MYQNYLQQPTPHYGLKGRPVSSLDETKAANIDFDGSLYQTNQYGWHSYI